VRRATLCKVTGWPALLAAILNDNRHLRGILQGAKPLWERPLAISPIPYGYLAAQPGGVWCVGDQAAVIPSFTGDGMSIALHSASLAAQMFLAGESAETYHRALREQLSRGMFLATCSSRAVVSRPGRVLAPLYFSIFPNAMRWMAASTRIPDGALLTFPDAVLT
jgi:flavin-dependent dehydrogenase